MWNDTIGGGNVIIEAGSVVTKDCEPNFVYAGVTVKKSWIYVTFMKKQKQLEEAVAIATDYYTRTDNCN